MLTSTEFQQNEKKETNKPNPVNQTAHAQTEVTTTRVPHSPARHNFNSAHSKLQFNVPELEHLPCTEARQTAYGTNSV
jgi:hypothetical protein